MSLTGCNSHIYRFNLLIFTLDMDSHEIDRLGEEIYASYKPLFDSSDLCLLSTMRYDPSLSEFEPTSASSLTKSNFFLFDEHYHRLKFTVDYFKRQRATNLTFNLSATDFLQKIIHTIETSGTNLHKALKIRILLSMDGKLKVELHETPERANLLDGILDPSSSLLWDVYKDPEFTISSPLTSFKTTSRDHYTQARNRCLPQLRPGCEEVLLQNPQGHATEGSITNFAVRKNGTWITPPLSTGCLCGVMRHFLLRKGYLKEQVVPMASISTGDELLLFNGIMGVIRAKVK